MIIIPAILESFRSLKDRTYKVVYETSELSPEQIVGINSSLGQAGYLAFKNSPFKQQEKELLNSLEADFEDKRKTPGQRLRGVLYRLWEQEPEGYEDFSRYYEFHMEKIITHFKNKLA